MSSQREAERARFIEEAQASAPVDAAFLIIYYNTRERCSGPTPWPSPISPREVFGFLGSVKFPALKRKANILLQESGRVGDVHFDQSVSKSAYDEVVHEFKSNNPGFSERCYNLAISQAIQAMR